MKTKQHLLFAALLISCFGAGSLASNSFSSANFSNNRTIKQASKSPTVIETGSLVDDITCEITDITYATGSATLGLNFKMNDPDTDKEYALCTLPNDNYVKNVEDLVSDLPKLEYSIKKSDGTIEVQYCDILKTSSEQFTFDILGPDKEELFGTSIFTRCTIENFDSTTSELLFDEFKVLNLYDYSTNEFNLLSDDGVKFNRHYCVPVVKEGGAIVEHLEDFIDVHYKGAATFNGIGSVSYGITNSIEPDLTQYRVNILKEEAKVKKAEMEKCKEIFEELDKTLDDFEKENPLDIFGYQDAKNAYDNALGEYNAAVGSIEKINSGVYKVRAYINFHAANKLNIYYEDGTIGQAPLTETFFEITRKHTELTFFDVALNRKDIVAVEPEIFNITIRVFDTSVNAQGKQNNVFQKAYDLTHTFCKNKLIAKEATYTSENGNTVTLKATNPNPYYIDCNLAFWLSALIVAVVYEIVSVILFFYFKEKNKDDIFKRVRPKQYWKTNTMGLITIEVLLIALMSISFRFTCIGNSLVVTNPVDAIIVAFSIGSIILVGYFIRYFAIQIKNIRDKRRNEKLRIGSDKVDDGTISVSK